MRESASVGKSVAWTCPYCGCHVPTSDAIPGHCCVGMQEAEDDGGEHEHQGEPFEDDHPNLRLWVCDPCEMIGEKDEADRHCSLTGHSLRELSQDETDGVRELWLEERAKRVAAICTLGKWARGEYDDA